MPIAGQNAGAGAAADNRMAYQNIPSEQYWTPGPDEKPGMSYGYDAPKKSNKKAWIIGGVIGAVVVIGAIVGGVVGGVMKSKSNSGSSGSGSNSNGATLSNPNDPSSFSKDPNLHQSFWGFAYTPEVSLITT